MNASTLREDLDAPLAEPADVLAEPAFELLGSRAQSEIGLRGDQVHHRLRLGEIHLAVEKRALRKLTRQRRPRAVDEQQLQDSPGDEHATVARDLDDILAGVAGRRAENGQQHIIELRLSIKNCAEMLNAGRRCP